MAKKRVTSNQTIVSLLAKAVEYLQNREFNRAVAILQDVLQLSKSADDYESYACAQNILGVAYAAIGNETMAIDCYLSGLDCAVRHHCLKLLHLFYNNIGTRYQELDDHKTALSYFLRAQQELENDACRAEERYNIWRLITCVNILVSYIHLKNYERAGEYLALAESLLSPETKDTAIRAALLTMKCQLYWHTGQKDYVYQHADAVIESCPKILGSDFIQNMREICQLFLEMQDYDRLKQALEIFDRYANEQKNLYFQLEVLEYCLTYAQSVGDEEGYANACVLHTKLYLQYKQIRKSERIDACNQKIILQETESERRKAEFRSQIDPLTGLGNRSLLEHDFEKYMEAAKRDGGRLCLAIVDIDFFKLHNDTLGHMHGDDCLKNVSALLKRCVGCHGGVYRFGGDEFILLFRPDSVEEIKTLAENIRNTLDAEQKAADIAPAAVVTLSQGYAYAPVSSLKTKNAFLAKADAALYDVKDHGKNHYRIYEE